MTLNGPISSLKDWWGPISTHRRYFQRLKCSSIQRRGFRRTRRYLFWGRIFSKGWSWSSSTFPLLWCSFSTKMTSWPIISQTIRCISLEGFALKYCGPLSLILWFIFTTDLFFIFWLYHHTDVFSFGSSSSFWRLFLCFWWLLLIFYWEVKKFK